MLLCHRRLWELLLLARSALVAILLLRSERLCGLCGGRHGLGLEPQLVGQAHLARCLVEADGQLRIGSGRGCDERAQGGVGGEHADVSVAMTPGGRDEAGEPVEELERAEDDVVPAVDVSGRELDQGVLV